jgi:3-oxoadipate enol-lactonase
MKSDTSAKAIIEGSDLVDIAGARFEVSRADIAAPLGPVIAAAHPADAFGTATAVLLANAAAAPVVCINPRGIGASTPSSGAEQTLDEMVDDLEAARHRLGLGAWVFWGMSGGGWLGQIYARKYPDALVGLVLESTCACFRQRLGDPTCLLSPWHPAWRTILVASGLLGEDAHIDPVPGPTAWIEVAGIGSVWRQVGGPALLVAPFPVAAPMRARLPQLWAFDARPQLAAIRTPTLVIAGSVDPVAPLSHARALHAGIAGAELVIVDGAGHVPVTAGRPEVASAVQRFLRERVR